MPEEGGFHEWPAFGEAFERVIRPHIDPALPDKEALHLSGMPRSRLLAFWRTFVTLYREQHGPDSIPPCRLSANEIGECDAATEQEAVSQTLRLLEIEEQRMRAVLRRTDLMSGTKAV